MDRIERIGVKGYRRLQDINLEMRDLMVMIGANGSGKTSFLDLLSLLSASAKGNLNDALSHRGGLSQILTRGKAKQLTISVSEKEMRYQVLLDLENLSYTIDQESLSKVCLNSKGDLLSLIDSNDFDIFYLDPYLGEISPHWQYDYKETALSQVPKTYQESEKFRKMLASCTYYGAIDVSEKSPIRLTQVMRPAKLPGSKGEDLIPCLYDLRENDRDRFEIIENIISAAFPDFEYLSFPPVAAGTMSMTWKDKNFSQPLYIHELSEGTLRFLWLVTLLQSQHLSTITLIDEPEVSLHPELLRHLVYCLREASKRTQLVIATHSDRLIRFLEPKEVMICDLEDGEAKMAWADSLDLDKWLEDYTLDQIWAMNVIGGRP
jgi:predicted ATPase